MRKHFDEPENHVGDDWIEGYKQRYGLLHYKNNTLPEGVFPFVEL